MPSIRLCGSNNERPFEIEVAAKVKSMHLFVRWKNMPVNLVELFRTRAVVPQLRLQKEKPPGCWVCTKSSWCITQPNGSTMTTKQVTKHHTFLTCLPECGKPRKGERIRYVVARGINENHLRSARAAQHQCVLILRKMQYWPTGHICMSTAGRTKNKR